MIFLVILGRQVKSVHRLTSADKAALFLAPYSVIEASVTSDGGSSFDKLLHVMEDSEYQHVKELASQMRASSPDRPTTMSEVSHEQQYCRTDLSNWLIHSQ